MTTSVLDIGEVAKAVRLKPSALRYYEEKGLIRSVGRHGLRRLYSASVLDRLALILSGQAAGFSLQEIGALLNGAPGDVELKRALATKADDLDRRILQLSQMRDGLRHAAECQHPRLVECPHFIAGIRDALHSR